MSTPNGTTIFATNPDGSSEDVTESVQALYDLVLQSMDWGSGFFSAEEAVPVARIGRICGFAEAPEAERYLAEAQRQEREQEAKRRAWEQAGRPGRRP